MNILYLAKNIPFSNYRENGIILEQAKLFGESSVSIFYPSEIVWKKVAKYNSRLRADSELSGLFIHDGLKIKKIKYIRLFGMYGLEWAFTSFGIKKIDDKFDIIHAHMVFPDALIAMKLSKKQGIPFVVTPRQGDLINVEKSIVNKMLFKYILNKASAVIALTAPLSKRIASLAEGVNTILIPNFIHESFFDVSEIKIRDNSKKKVVISLVANHIKRKNIYWLLDYYKANKDFVELLICGDGALTADLKRYANEDGIFLGRLERKELIAVYDYSDIFALPSENETFGLVYAEAAARGNIVVGMSGTGLSDENLEGFYFAESKKAFYQLLDNLVKMPTEKREYIKLKASITAKNFQPETVKKKLMKLYEEVKNVET